MELKVNQHPGEVYNLLYVNPFNGIESTSLFKASMKTVSTSLGIHSMELKEILPGRRVVRASHDAGIHSMELKVLTLIDLTFSLA